MLNSSTPKSEAGQKHLNGLAQSFMDLKNNQATLMIYLFNIYYQKDTEKTLNDCAMKKK
jgi:hypothetical protein